MYIFQPPKLILHFLQTWTYNLEGERLFSSESTEREEELKPDLRRGKLTNAETITR